jgi:zinc transport system permease protein
VFALSWPVPLLLRRRRVAAELPPAQPAGALDEVAVPHVVAEDAHPHQHDPTCGHRAVRHGDHTDYLHEGHRHAAHADHYDEH